jgi:superfamily I DNA/RNA helicase
MRPEDWRPADGFDLEPNALTAATMRGRNVVVAAGPGAGKTELLAQRADFLLRTGSCPYPYRILAISFKVDAARNLRDRVRLRSGGQHAARLDSLTFHAFAKRLVDNFRPALGDGALSPDYTIDARRRVPGEQITFDDLVPLALKILKANAYARGAVRQTFTHVFLDEFQDATSTQYELLKAVFGESRAELTAVGDVKQRIMAWAGALDGVLKTFAEDFDAAPLPLYQNFRSAPALRRMQNRMIRRMDPEAASPDEDLVGDGGCIQVLPFDDQGAEAEAVVRAVRAWLDDGTPPSEIAVLVRQQARLVTGTLCDTFQELDIPYRNEQESQDLSAEPAAALIFNFLRVVADDRQPDAYAELMRIAGRASVIEEAAVRHDRLLKQLLQDLRASVREPDFDASDLVTWRPVIARFLESVTRPALVALSAAYAQGSRLDDVVAEAIDAFGRELAVDGDPAAALKRLSEIDAIRILTIHKCKGLEFERVVVLGVERELFWGSEAMSEFFVAISRAKDVLLLTHVAYREKPAGAGRWDNPRAPYTEFLDFARED